MEHCWSQDYPRDVIKNILCYQFKATRGIFIIQSTYLHHVLTFIWASDVLLDVAVYRYPPIFFVTMLSGSAGCLAEVQLLGTILPGQDMQQSARNQRIFCMCSWCFLFWYRSYPWGTHRYQAEYGRYPKLLLYLAVFQHGQRTGVGDIEEGFSFLIKTLAQSFSRGNMVIPEEGLK